MVQTADHNKTHPVILVRLTKLDVEPMRAIFESTRRFLRG